MSELQEAGNFRGRIVEYGLYEAESGAKAVTLKVAIDEYWDSGSQQWGDWRNEDLTTSGSIWVIKRDGTINSKQASALVEHAGWDTSFVSIANGTWKPTPVQVSVEPDVYKYETRYRINWLNGYDSTPGGGNVSLAQAKELEAQFGSQMRAIGGNVTRNAPPATAAPLKTPRGKAVAQPVPARPAETEQSPNDDIPF